MARIHDESLRYALSDQAIVALATKIPKTPTEMYDTISHADLNLDSSNANPSPCLSPIVYAHLMEFFDLLQDDTVDPDGVFRRIVEKQLGSSGSCQLSVYNYALLSKSGSKLVTRLVFKQNGGKPTKETGRKNSRELFVQKFSCKSPVYHNCRIYASDGRLLCYCNHRKLEWYLSRDLAKLVDDDPLAIMLLFEPKGRPEDEDNEFYIQSKKNICVGCGEGNHYLRYRIIPSCYRIHFPEHLKSHRSHDIVLLCVDCHEIAHCAAEKYKKQIAKEFGIPLFLRSIVDSGQKHITTGTSGLEGNNEEAGVSPLQLRTAAMALVRHGSRMPLERREELIQVVRAYFGGREISDSDLETAVLVGMSPQERRRLEKKRGLHVKNSTGDILLKNCHENNCNNISTSSTETLGSDPKSDDGLHFSKESEDGVSEGKDTPKDMDNGTRDNSVHFGTKDDSLNNSDENFNETPSERGTDGILDTNNSDYINRSVPRSHDNASSKYAQKLSLLGHGPHGKQVVEHLLKEHEEDGILKFCQRWRQVFVESLHPRFLPAGWDIMHSGRRDFGEYSVYNPTKKAQKDL